MARNKDFDWDLTEKPTVGPSGSRTYSTKTIELSILLDLRDELKENNKKMERLLKILECRNFKDIPRKLERIAKHTTRIPKP